MKKIIILGTGGNCIDILDAIQDLNDTTDIPAFECIGFLDDNSDKWKKLLLGVPIFGGLDIAGSFPQDVFFVNGIGSTSTFANKQKMIGRMGISDERFHTVIHPSASVSRLAVLGRGSVVLQNAVIASHANVGNHVMVLPLSVISHDAVVGDYSIIAGGACISGGVQVGKSCYIGSNSTIRGNLHIGDNALVGMGATVLNDVPPGTVMVGNPARQMRNQNNN